MFRELKKGKDEKEETEKYEEVINEKKIQYLSFWNNGEYIPATLWLAQVEKYLLVANVLVWKGKGKMWKVVEGAPFSRRCANKFLQQIRIQSVRLKLSQYMHLTRRTML